MLRVKRVVLNVTGQDAEIFLNSLLTKKLGIEYPVYALMLAPNGKFLYDFFLLKHPNGIFLEIYEEWKTEILNKLSWYKLRALINIEETDFKVYTSREGQKDSTNIVFNDPRHHDLGYRIWSVINHELLNTDSLTDYEKIRIEHIIPEAGKELIKGIGFPLQYNLESAIDFSKGCYLGQEVTNRIKRGLLNIRDKLFKLQSEDLPPYGEQVVFNGKSIGTMYSKVERVGLALLNIEAIQLLGQSSSLTIIA